MDFKSLMAAQISKNKPASTSTNGTSKYQRRGDAERDREAKYAQEQARLETERLERLEKKRKLEDEEAERVEAREEKRRKLAGESRVRREEREAEEERLRRKRLGLPERPPSTAADGGDDEADRPDIPDDELRTKLAGLKQPEAIENETHTERLYRYYKLTSKALKRRQWYPGPIPTTIEPLPADEILLPEKPPAPSDRDAYIKLHRQISSYLNFVLTEWSAALAGRDKDDAQSSAGIAATNNYRIALEDLKPLVRRLEAAVYNPTPKPDAPTTSTPLQHEALLIPIVQILHLTQKRHYRDAVDAYLRLSIGKAAWPIGVTMVGIHERSAREKLHEDGKNRDIAHIMSDEGTRKWLQSLKRLVSFSQTRWEVFDVGQLMG
ncbi:hypothetical protein LTR70_009551 [Exophiala xenobiotica]|nr:hypothetical protein LTR70_009551 [Exophiala xenobiotica]